MSFDDVIDLMRLAWRPVAFGLAVWGVVELGLATYGLHEAVAAYTTASTRLTGCALDQGKTFNERPDLKECLDNYLDANRNLVGSTLNLYEKSLPYTAKMR